MPGCCVHSGCIRRKNRAVQETKNRSDEGRCHHRPVVTLTHSAWLVNRSLPVHAGIDVAVIALWLGHEQMATANIYLHADMEEKERAIARVTPPDTAPGRYQPPDPLLAFLDSL